jgi:diaminopimelate decarboxylase
MAGFCRNAQGVACLGGTALGELLERAAVPTPVYLYDVDAVIGEAERLRAAIGPTHLVAYAVKANSAGTLVRALAGAGCGADVVSGGELALALAAGVAPAGILLSGVAKTDAELDQAIAAGICAIQLESVEEVQRVAARARAAGRRARVSLRVNPGIAIDSHAHVATGHDEAKFGIVRSDLGEAWQKVDAAADTLDAVGVSTHVGSMLLATEHLESARALCDVARARRSRAKLEIIDFGGGFGIDYGDRPTPPPAAFGSAVADLLHAENLADLRLVLEPGRALVAPHGVLVASVVQGKRSGARAWAMIDAGMNDLLRPALYAARHRIEPLERPPGGAPYRVVGPVCESADDFGEHALGDSLPARVVIRDAGAYGFAMASEYNGRPLPSEVFVSDGKIVKVSASPGVEGWLARRLGA